MKLLVLPSSISQIEDLLPLVDGFILSMDNLSVNGSFYMDINTLEKLVLKLKENKKEIFASLNKNIFNIDLNLLKETLLKLNKMDIDGIFYYDLSVLSIVRELNLKLNLIWSQEHLTTNYLTCEYYREKGAKGVYLSSEITLKEILEIKNNTSLFLIVPIFGFLPMFNSKRHIVNNYLEYFHLKDESKINYIEKEGYRYPIVDDKNGTTVYSSQILNGIEEYLILKEKMIDYVTLNSFNIDDIKFKEVVTYFKTVNKENVSKYNNKINDMFHNVDKGFLHKETIYKVKNDEKRSN